VHAHRRRRRSSILRRALVGLAIGLAAATLAILLKPLPFVRRAEHGAYDLIVKRIAQPVDPASPVVIVEINESSIRALAPLIGRWPWPRVIHASAIEYLARAGAKVIAYDVLLTEPAGQGTVVINGQSVDLAASDQALVNAVRSAGNVVLLADATYEGLTQPGVDEAAALEMPGAPYRPGSGFQARPFVLLPFTPLAGAAAGIGHNLLVRDEASDAVRRILPFIEHRGTAVPSLGLAAAVAFSDTRAESVRLDGEALRIGERRLPLLADPAPAADGGRVPSRQALLRLVLPVTEGGVRSTFPTHSFFDVLLSADQLAAGTAPAVPPSGFAGKLVFVGTTAAGTFDRYSTPFEGGAPGVELHATLADNLLSGRTLRVARGVDLTITFVAAVATGLVATMLPVGWAVALVAAMAAGLYAWIVQQAGQGLALAVVMPAAAMGLALFGGVAWQYFVEGREKREVRRMFGRYVSNDVIETLSANPSLAGLGGQRRDMTVLFSDMRGFTAATEKGTPEGVVAQLNEYFTAMVEVLFRHRGTLDKFVGDMVMGLFGAPLDDPHHADHAVAAALDMLRALDTLNARWRAEGRPPVDIGIGINSGEMIAGNIGSAAIMSYTVIGDAVNLGARLESLNKEHGTRILISEETRARLTRPVTTRRVGEVTVKGRAQPVLVHEVLSEPAPPATGGGPPSDEPPGERSRS
jgi:adenylate cyclase